MPIAFILAATEAGPMIINRFDVCYIDQGYFGVGASLLQTGRFDPEEVDALTGILRLRRQHHGDGVVALDLGANVGTHTIAWARAMTGWGSVLAVEAQEWVYYALAGNLALNNLFNVTALHAAIGERDGSLMMPVLDPTKPASFGSLELRPKTGEHIGQIPEGSQPVPMVTIDALAPARVDLIKLDIEGMELDALAGAEATVARCQPVIFAERTKCGEVELADWLMGRHYKIHPVGMSFLAIHHDDPILANVTFRTADMQKPPA